MKKTICILFLVFIFSNIYSQNYHFSMFNKCPLLLNPAKTGNFKGKWRAGSIYKKQGDFNTNPYNTYLTSFDMPIFLFNRNSSFGLVLLNDQTADKTLNTSLILFNTAYFLKITKKSYLHAGFGFGIANKRLSNRNLTFPNQFDNSTGQFNSNLDNYENFNHYNKWYADLSWGVMWSRITKKFKFQIGFSMYHYNKPSLEIINPDFKINPKYQIHFFSEKTITKKIYIKPKLSYTYQSKASEILVGADIGVNFKNRLKKIYAGTFIRTGINRNTDATIFCSGINYKNLKLNVSYDYSLHVFKPQITKDFSFEISIFFIFPRLEPDYRAIQCDIF